MPSRQCHIVRSFGFFLFSRGCSRTTPALTPLAKLLQFLVWREAFPPFLASPFRRLSTATPPITSLSQFSPQPMSRPPSSPCWHRARQGRFIATRIPRLLVGRSWRKRGRREAKSERGCSAVPGNLRRALRGYAAGGGGGVGWRWVADVGWMGLVGEGTRHSDVTAAELGWYSIAYSPNPPMLLLALPETGGVGDGGVLRGWSMLVFAMPFHGKCWHDNCLCYWTYIYCLTAIVFFFFVNELNLALLLLDIRIINCYLSCLIRSIIRKMMNAFFMIEQRKWEFDREKESEKRNSFLSSWCELYGWRRGEGRYQSHG